MIIPEVGELNSGIELLKPQSHKHVAIIPLKTEPNYALDILTLKKGFELGLVEVKELEHSTVNTLIVKNNAVTPLLLIDGEEVAFTVREFDLLFKLLSFPKKTFTRSALMAEFWDYDSSATSRTVDVYMAKIRDKTAACDGFEILTVHGLGYKAVLK